jgi:hypothetical protein
LTTFKRDLGWPEPSNDFNRPFRDGESKLYSRGNEHFLITVG